MTSPPIFNWGPSSDQYYRELAQFEAQRDSFYQNFMNKTNLAGQLTGMQPATGQVPYQGMTAEQQGAASQPPVEQWEDADLLGAAKFWGIDESAARQMPRDVLINELNKLRGAARPSEATVANRMQDAGMLLASLPAMFALGVGEAITGGLGNLPGVGGALKKQKPLHDADLWLRSLEEGVRASNPEDMKYALNTAEFSGNVAALWYPAAGSWALSGKVLGGVFKGAPILRASLQGAMATGLLEGGSEHPLRAMAFGAALGLPAGALENPAVQEWLQAAGSKIAKKFVTPAVLGPERPGALLRMDQASDLTNVASAAMQGDESAIAMMEELQRTGRMPKAQIVVPVGNRPLPQNPMLAKYVNIAQDRGLTQDIADLSAQGLETNELREILAGKLQDLSPLDQQNVILVTKSHLGIPSMDNPREFDAWTRSLGMNTSSAEDAAVQMNKAGTIIESPALPQAVKATAPDETTVAFAAQASNPGGTNVIEGIADPAAFVNKSNVVQFPFKPATSARDWWDRMGPEYRPDVAPEIDPHLSFDELDKFSQKKAENIYNEISTSNAALSAPTSGDIKPDILGLFKQESESFASDQYIGYATRNGRLTAITSDRSVTPEMISEYEQHGMYTGQKVMAPGGQEMEITGFNNGNVYLINYYSGATLRLKPSEVSPLTQSPGVHEVPALWNAFTNFADQMAVETQAMMGGALSPEQLHTVKSSSMQQWMEDFLDQVGVVSPGDRARITNYFNQQWVAGFYPEAPQQTAQNLAAQAEMHAAQEASTPTALGRVDDQAATKGFRALPNGQGGWILADAGLGTQTQGAQLSFDSLEAAEQFLNKFNRELPDISPNLSVPGELAGVLTREPPPEINVNAKFTGKISKSISKMAAGNGGVPPVNPAEVGQAAGDGNVGKLNNLWKDGFMRWEPARRVFSKVSQQVRQAAGDDFGVARIYDEMGVKLNQHHTAMAPFQNELADVFKGVTTRKMLNGEFIDVWSIPDPNLRALMAQKLGWDKKDVASLVNFDNLLSKIHSNAEAPAELRGLITYMRQQKSLGENPWTGYQVGTTTADWYEVAKGSDFGIREMDPRRLGDSYIRAVFWQRDMAETFAAAKDVAKNLKGSEQLAPVGHFLDNWLDVVKNGYRPEDDIALDGIHALGRAVLGKSFSRQQARELVSLGLNTTHASMLGYRVHVMARDALQLFFALPRAGPELAEVITKFTTNPKFRQSVWDEVFSEGAASALMPMRVSPGALEGELEAAGAGLPPEGMSRRMQAAGWLTGAIRDILPDFVKGSSESPLRPLYFYGKQGQMMRSLVYKAGQLKAERALEAFRKNLNMDELMGASGARTFDPAWQEEFKRLVSTGNDEKAASFLGRQLADATQFKYGVAENPAVSRTITGRLFMQMGSYQTQYLQYLRESLANGTVGDKAKLLLTMGAVSAGLEAASKETGWNFRWMNPYMIGFVGGPWVSTGAAMLQGAGALMRTAQGDGTVTPFQSNVMNAGLQAAGDAATALNPLNGLYQTATGLGSAINDSPTPGAAIGRLMLTGQRGALPDILNSIGIGQMQPAANPMRMDQLQLPYTPQMQPVYPSLLPAAPNGGSFGTGPVNSPNVVPVPGGGAAGQRPTQNDSNFIAFNSHADPYAPSGYNVTDIQSFLIEQASGAAPSRAWDRILRPQDLQLLRSLNGMPVAQALSVFRSQLANESMGNAAAGQGTGPSGYNYNPNNPGSGGMF